MDDKEFEESLKAVIDINTNVETHPDVNKGPMMCALQADINSVYGQALLALGKNEESITRHKKELAAAKKSGITDLKVRAMDNLAVSKIDFLSSDSSLILKIFSGSIRQKPKLQTCDEHLPRSAWQLNFRGREGLALSQLGSLFA